MKAMIRAATLAIAWAVLLGAASAMAAGTDSGITLRDPWVRVAAPGVPVAAGYVLIINAGATDDELLSASSPRAASVQIHETSMRDGMMRMREVDSVRAPAHGRVALEPNGLHLMIMGLDNSLKTGGLLPIRLRFKRAGEIEGVFEVR